MAELPYSLSRIGLEPRAGNVGQYSALTSKLDGLLLESPSCI